MSYYDIGIVCSILHGLVMVLGYLMHTNIHNSVRLIADPTAQYWFSLAHHITPTFVVAGTFSCWMSIIHQNQGLAVFFLIFPIAFGAVAIGVYGCSSFEERGPTNKEILTGSSQGYFHQYLSHVDFANEMIARIEAYQEHHPGHQLEYSPYLQRRARGGSMEIPR